ncbi:glutamyl-tRNA synthetase [Tistlia consotensis]|uniref:Glutamate--tRNA ligase n=1 Tax=Tistlia consotensis USBA 355 TaxID=560819 RepID=A0A1Y6CR55_9PROT|nr:glutamate--tRNA ligase [Tistlia consotensis]SMF84499.1 glutamyl-tRNA synthetase [Tistlia consotensis USBA 355]SNS36377.1 glutamyl-tRNA synthetase [Tistlia consotensis]
MKVRFAPSPTGRLHVGNARVALLNWLWARQAGGHFLLRLDDTDVERSTAEYAAGIEEDLAWLGLAWDAFARQSDRLDRYAAAAERLKAAGRLYPCYETAEELELKRRLQLKSGRPPLYDRAALKLDAAARAGLEAEGRAPHWRFRLEHAAVAWDDSVRGAQRFEGDKLSDPVLLRADGRPLYTLSSVVDDLELGISHVLRGEDHVANTAVQIQLFEALGGPVPVFAHLPLLTDARGQGLSKRLGSLALRHFWEEGLEPMALNSYLARLGTPDPIEPRQDLEELVAAFDVTRFGRATPKYDPAELEHLNARLLHAMPYATVRPWLEARGFAGFDEALWLAVRGNLARRGEAGLWYQVARGTIRPAVEEPDYLAEAARLLPPEPWDGTTWKAWTEALKQATGRKGKALFLPLRLALTGQPHGPEMSELLPLIGRERVLERLAPAGAKDSLSAPLGGGEGQGEVGDPASPSGSAAAAGSPPPHPSPLPPEGAERE